MEENIEQIVEEVVEEKAEKIEKTTESVWEERPYNRNERYIPTEFQIIDYRRSWKKCHCGRQTWMNDNFCPGCGQRLGRPSMDA